MDLDNLMPALRSDKISEETKSLISTLPSYTNYFGKVSEYQGCWYYDNTLQALLNIQRGFKPQDTDIILASFPKSGTTWLKALTVALLERLKNRSSDNHPLLSDNPHGIVPSLEFDVYLDSSSPDLAKFSSSPRLFSTHMPLHAIQDNLKDSQCKIVYVCRNPKDTLTSWWLFRCANCKIDSDLTLLESMFESFCSGSIYFGPFWEHILGYWRRSLEAPKHVLFMRYEEIKAEPRYQIKRLAEFLDCSFTKEEEESGMVDKILDLCSFRNLSTLEVNKRGKTNNMDHNNFFRKGEVGDWKNFLTPKMENKIDMITREKLQGSGLKF